MRCLGYQQIASLGTPQSLTPPAGSVIAWLQAETQNVRFMLNGDQPAAGQGMILYAGDPPLPTFDNLVTARFIEVAPSAKLNVMYFG